MGRTWHGRAAVGDRVALMRVIPLRGILKHIYEGPKRHDDDIYLIVTVLKLVVRRLVRQHGRYYTQAHSSIAHRPDPPNPSTPLGR